MTPQVLFIVAGVLAIIAAVLAGVERAFTICLLAASVAFIAFGLANL